MSTEMDNTTGSEPKEGDLVDQGLEPKEGDLVDQGLEPKEGDLVDQVFEKIVVLLRGRGVARAAKLTDVGLAKRLGVSRTPVRMALARLEGAGVLQKEAGGGWLQPAIRAKDLRDIMELGEVLEPMLARKAALNMDPESRAELMSSIQEMEQALHAKDMDLWRSASDHYEAVLIRAADNPKLGALLVQLDDQWGRLSAVSQTMETRMPTSLEEHRAIAKAIVAGEAELAGRLTNEHVVRIKESLMSLVENVLVPLLGEEL